MCIRDSLFQHQISASISTMPFFSYFQFFKRSLLPFLASFWHDFPYLLHAFFWHRFCIDFGLIFDTFLHAENLKFYVFLNSFVAFRLFRKNIKNRWFWHHFGIIFLYFFGIGFWMPFWIPFCRFFVENGRQKDAKSTRTVRTFGAPDRSKNAPKTQPRFYIDCG